MRPLSIPLLVLITNIYLVSGATTAFKGGTLSYTVDYNNATSKSQVHLDFVIAFDLGTGPCGSPCVASKIGQSITGQSGITWQLDSVDITNKVQTTSHRKLIGSSDVSHWEQEWLTATFDLDTNTEQTLRADGINWAAGSAGAMVIESVINPNTRNDTRKPNRSPVALVKPVYSVKAGSRTKLHIAAIDPDGDFIKCQKQTGSTFNTGIIINDDCTIDVDASSLTDGQMLPVQVTIKDYSTRTITIENGRGDTKNYVNKISEMAVQFLIAVKTSILGPVFVDPTMANNRKVQIYLGATFETKVCAETTQNNLPVTFRVTEREGKSLSVSNVPVDQSRPNVQCAEFTWKPTDIDEGYHVICLTAIDSNGNDSPEDNCFLIQVLKVPALTNTSPAGQFYFVDFPKTITTDSKTAVIVPIPVHSNTEPNIYVETTDLQYEKGPIVKDSSGNYVQSFMLYEDDFGPKVICFAGMDTNRNAVPKTCLGVKYLPPDPCIKIPCHSQLECRRKGDSDVDFECDCVNGRGGKDCSEQEITPCSPDPCLHSRKCLDNHRGGFKCLCNRGYDGEFCQKDINECASASCNQANSVCMDKANDKTCKCFPGFGDSDCNTDDCTATPASDDCKARTCPASPSNAVCISCGPCQNGGVCMGGSSCVCPYGFTGRACDSNIQPSTNLTFVPPTLGDDTTLTCFSDGSATEPCHVTVAIASPNGQPTKLIISQATGTFKEASTVGTFRLVQGGRYDADISIKGNKDAGMNFFCVKAFYNTSSIERCFALDYKTNQASENGSFEFSQKNRPIKFEPPTPNPGTRFSCSPGSICRFWIYTTKDGGTTCKKVKATDVSVTVFPPDAGGTVCKTEVSFQSSSSGITDLCFQSWENAADSQIRCFKMEQIAQGSDPCNSKPCQNDGLCIRNGTSNYFCMCDKGFQGPRCEKGLCAEDASDCVHGQCAIYNNVKSCLCDIGYTGDKCDKETHNTVGGASSHEVYFTDMGVPKKVICIHGQPCYIVLAVSGQLPSGEIPLLLPGYVSQEVHVDNISVRPTTSVTGSYEAIITVSSMKLGQHTVCIQSFNNKRVNTDELCFDIQVTDVAAKIYSYKDRPHFIEPSLSPDSEMKCVFNETCHIKYIISPGGNNRVAIDLSSDQLKTALIQSDCDIKGLGRPCYLDISVRPRQDEVSKDFDICAALSVKDANTKGETRCFKLTVGDVNDQRRCRDTHCENGGFCDGHSNSAICDCPSGFAGSSCEQRYDPGLSGHGSSSGDKAVPKSLSCKLGRVCTIPLKLYLSEGRCTSPKIRAGYVSAGLDFIKATMTFVEEGNLSTNFSGTVDLMPQVTGTEHICIQASSNGTTLIELCYTILVTDAPEVNLKRPYFVAPTYQDGAVLRCEESTACRLDLHFVKGSVFQSSLACPEIRDVSPTLLGEMRILRSFASSSKCTAEVVLNAQGSGTKDMCFQLVLPQNIGEKRCFHVEVVNGLTSKVKTPCNGVACAPWEICISNLTTTASPKYTCVNDTNTSFKKDSDDANFIDLPQFTENLGCVDQVCTVPLYVHSPVKEITILGVTQGQNESVFTIGTPGLWCHDTLQVYKANLSVMQDKFDTTRTLCIVANDSNGMATDVSCIAPRPVEPEGLNLGIVVGGAVGGLAVLGGGIAGGLFLRKKQVCKKVLSRRQSKVDTPDSKDSKKKSKNGSKNGVSVIEMDSENSNEQITEIVLSMKVKKAKK